MGKTKKKQKKQVDKREENAGVPHKSHNPAGQGFWHPDPKMPRYLCPDPDRTKKIVNFMAPTPDRPSYIFPGPYWTEITYHQTKINNLSFRPVSDYNNM